MFTTSAILLFSALSAHALVSPNEPGPGSIYKEGGSCHIAWAATGDDPKWKDMTITLRTGSNTDMQSITVVATGQDGSVAGSFDYPCPDVTPQAAIYFYEFTAAAAAADGPQWTTRFTIAAADGSTVDPENSAQPNGQQIPWGVGKLESGTASGITGSPTGAASGTGAATTAASGPASGASGASSAGTSASTPAAGAAGSSSSSSHASSASASSASKTGSGASASSSSNAALSSASLSNSGILGFLGVTAMFFTLML